jgi:hypothetical protein
MLLIRKLGLIVLLSYCTLRVVLLLKHDVTAEFCWYFQGVIVAKPLWSSGQSSWLLTPELLVSISSATKFST